MIVVMTMSWKAWMVMILRKTLALHRIGIVIFALCFDSVSWYIFRIKICSIKILVIRMNVF